MPTVMLKTSPLLTVNFDLLFVNVVLPTMKLCEFIVLLALVASSSTVAAFCPPPPNAVGHTLTTRLRVVVSTEYETQPVKAPVFNEICDTTGVTLKRFMNEVATLNPDLTELSILFGAVETSCKAISNLVRKSQLPSQTTLGYQSNAAAAAVAHNRKEIETDPKKLGGITNDLLKRALRFTGRLGVLASEEEDTPLDFMPNEPADKEVLIDESLKYVAVFDPLDGSSNLGAGLASGTIIGIFEHDETCNIDPDCVGEDCEEQEAICLANTLRPGNNLVAAAYCLYSSSTILVLTLGFGTYSFCLDESIGEFVLSHPNIKIPETSSTLSFNEAKSEQWDDAIQRVVAKWKKGTGKSGKQFSSRYIGSMVADVHRTLFQGGVFGYPADKDNDNGKLHLLYECAPISFIVEQAGGLATTGRERILAIQPEFVHQRVPIILGSKSDVQEILDAYAASSKDD